MLLVISAVGVLDFSLMSPSDAMTSAGAHSRPGTANPSRQFLVIVRPRLRNQWQAAIRRLPYSLGIAGSGAVSDRGKTPRAAACVILRRRFAAAPQVRERRNEVNAISMARHCVFAGVGVVLACVSGSAQASQASKAALNVKLGLWEVTSSTQTSGTPEEIPDLQKLPPEQRARAAAMMKALKEGVAAPHTTKSCLTREKLDRALFEDNSRDNCTQTVLTNSPSVYAFKFVCTGRNASSGEWKFEALSPQAVKGSGTMSLDNTMSAKSTIAAKWIAASCGDVK